jgi:hypothetical protein
MKLIAVVVSALVGTYSPALAQGNPSGPGATTGDPAASSAAPGADPAKTVGQSNPSGSGTSTSGGTDYNGDQGRDKMPESSVSPSAGKPDISNPTNKK